MLSHQSRKCRCKNTVSHTWFNKTDITVLKRHTYNYTILILYVSIPLYEAYRWNYYFISAAPRTRERERERVCGTESRSGEISGPIKLGFEFSVLSLDSDWHGGGRDCDDPVWFQWLTNIDPIFSRYRLLHELPGAGQYIVTAPDQANWCQRILFSWGTRVSLFVKTGRTVLSL